MWTGEIGHGLTCPDDDEARQIFGCDGGAGQEWHIDEAVYAGCPLSVMTEQVTDTLLSWRALAAHGTWPTGGGTDDQSAWFVMAAAVLDGERSEYEKREIDRKRKWPNAISS